MITAPNVLTAKAKAAFTQAVRDEVDLICARHGVEYGRLKVEAFRSPGRGVWPGISIIDPQGEVHQHYAVAQDVKARGWATAMLFGFSTGSGVVTYESFYPMRPDSERVSRTH